MKQFYPLLITSLLLSLNGVQAQEEFPLWKTNIPGQLINSEVKEFYEGGTSETDVLRVHQVVKPTLRMFLASKEKTNGAAVLICPGGGYKILAIDHEGYKIAKWLNSFGISAFVLKSRLPDDRIMVNKSVGPLQDAQKAMRIIRQNAQKWNIDPQKIGVLGFSAGGHLAASLSTHYDAEVYPNDNIFSARPDFSILVYPVISFQNELTHGGSRTNLLGTSPSQEEIDYFSNELQINQDTPPALLIHSIDDEIVPFENSIAYLKELKKQGITTELHAFSDGGHGYGLGNWGTHSMWSKNAENWLTTLFKNK
ncbi:MAG: alpha/beta hydrolase [Flavobacteriaceae bacterium]|jgi:acetyl esterase/lipase|nr:alpha/beta hydrolase [Flavobacteriaceae bacterium]